MKVKLFFAAGMQQIDLLENNINAWLDTLPDTSRVAHTNTTSCTVSNQNHASVTVTIWYHP